MYGDEESARRGPREASLSAEELSVIGRKAGLVGGKARALTKELLEGGQTGFVECLDGILFDPIAPRIRAVVYPRKQRGGRLVRIGARRLPGFEPSVDETPANWPKLPLESSSSSIFAPQPARKVS